MPKMQPEIFSSPVIHRYNGGTPVLSKENILSVLCTCVFYIADYNPKLLE